MFVAAAFLMVTAFPPGYVFLFFCGMMVIQLVWVKAMVPETKGVTLEQMQDRRISHVWRFELLSSG